MKLTATIEQAQDGTYTTLAVVGEHTIIGTGATREEAVASLQSGARGLVEYLKSEGRSLPQVVSVEIAA